MTDTDNLELNAEWVVSNAKHTPGPWRYSTYGTQVLTGDSWSSICELKGDARWEDGRGRFANMDEQPWATQLANAQLIAAAPDMLEALCLFIAEHDNTYDGEPLSMEMDRFITKARNAIAKATLPTKGAKE